MFNVWRNTESGLISEENIVLVVITQIVMQAASLEIGCTANSRKWDA